MRKVDWRFSNGRQVRIATVLDYVRVAIVPETHFGRRTGYCVMTEKVMHGRLKDARAAAAKLLEEWTKE